MRHEELALVPHPFSEHTSEETSVSYRKLEYVGVEGFKVFRSHTHTHPFMTLLFKDPQGKVQGPEAGHVFGQDKCIRRGSHFFLNHLCGFIIQFHFLPLMSHFLQGSVPAPEAISLLSVLSFSKPDKESQVSCLDPCKELLQTSSDQKSAVVSFPLRNWCRRWHSITLLSFLTFFSVPSSTVFCHPWRGNADVLFLAGHSTVTYSYHFDSCEFLH